MLTKLALWYLRNRKVTVIMNYKVEGGKLTQKTNEGYTYDTDYNDSEIYLSNGNKFNVPEGKFKIVQTF
jgi:hypothetical protein